MTLPSARTRSRILGLDGPHRGMFCLAWDWTVTLSIRLVTPCNLTPPRSAWIGFTPCAWGVVMVGVMRAILTALLVGYFSLPLVGGEKEDFESIKADAEKGDARAPEEAHRLTCGNGCLTHSSGLPITFGSGPMNFKESPL